MNRIITIASNKGGVGKTTTALNLGYSLSRLGNEVLLLDGDLQGGIESSTNLKKVTSQGLIACLRGQATLADLVRYTRTQSMAVVGLGVTGADDVFVLEQAAATGRLGTMITELSRAFDYVLIDVPAGFGGTVQTYLQVSDGVLLVLNCRSLTVKTLPPFLKVLKGIQERNPSLRLEGVLLTMINRKSIRDINMMSELRKMLPAEVMLRSTIPANDLFERASLRSIPVGMLPDSQSAARPYIDLAIEVKERELERSSEEVTDDDEGLF